jgi:predicted O-methyltransferase YrrM
LHDYAPFQFDTGMQPASIVLSQETTRVDAQGEARHTFRLAEDLGNQVVHGTVTVMDRDGKLITLEIDPTHAEIARRNFAQAGLNGQVDLRVGSAHETLPALTGDPAAPFDLVFVDADKASTTAYLEWALKLTHPGSLIFLDNVVRNGAVANPDSTDPNVQGIQRGLELLANEPRVTVTAIQTVGGKSYDGFALALVTA